MGSLLTKIGEWRRYPEVFVREVVGAVPTNQQLEGFRELGRIYDAKYRKSMGALLSAEDERYAGKIGISIRSGHGTGKDAWLSWVYLWLITVFPGCRGLVTAPTQHQLQDILWPEIRAWVKRSRGKLWENVEVAAEKVRRIGGKGDEEAFVVNRTARVTGSADEQAETLAGLHHDFMILAVDEASGVPDGVFRPLEGAMSGRFNIGILIGNPTRNSGYFFQSHNLDRRNWVALHWSCEKSNMDEVTGTSAMAAFIERVAAKHGTESNYYRMRVQGEFPQAEPDALIPLDQILAATEREIFVDESQGLVLGVDVAYMGDDKTAICPRRGMLVEPILTYSGLNTVDTAIRVMGAMAEYAPKAVVIDRGGVGAGVVDQVQAWRKSVNGIYASESAMNKQKFSRLRDELYWRLRERFEKGRIAIPPDDELIGELSGIKWRMEISGKIKIESKADMRKRGLASPNKADSLMLTEYYPDTAFRNQPVDRYSVVRQDTPKRGWMGV
jgi:phage terminase large subunit